MRNAQHVDRMEQDSGSIAGKYNQIMQSLQQLASRTAVSFSSTVY